MSTQSKMDLGVVKIHKNVIASISSIAALEIEGVKQIGAGIVSFHILELIGLRSSKGIRVEFGHNDEIKLEIPLVVKYGYNIPDIAERVQDNVKAAIERMTDKSLQNIVINIQGIERIQKTSRPGGAL